MLLADADVRRRSPTSALTRTQDELLALLADADVSAIADVCVFPSLRRHPHFTRGTIESWMPEAAFAVVGASATLSYPPVQALSQP